MWAGVEWVRKYLKVMPWNSTEGHSKYNKWRLIEWGFFPALLDPFPNKLLLAFASFLLQNLGPGHLRQYPHNPAMVMKSIITMNGPNGMMSRNQLTTINQSQLNGQVSLNMAGPNIAHTSPSPPASKSATPSPSSSINEDEQDESTRVSWIYTPLMTLSTPCRYVIIFVMLGWKLMFLDLWHLGQRSQRNETVTIQYWFDHPCLNPCRWLGRSDQRP